MTEGAEEPVASNDESRELPDYVAQAPPPPPRAGRGRLVALIVGLIAIAAGGVFAAVALTGDEGSPEDAVRDLFEAIEQEDVLGILEALPPSERSALRGPLIGTADQLKRLEILSGDLNLNQIRGLDFEFNDVELSSTTVGEGVAAVEITKGTVRTRVDPDQLPLGDFVRDIVGDAGEPSTESESIVEDAPTFVTIKEDGEWRVSIWYSIAESSRREAGLRAPRFGQGLRAVGAPTPEQVVQEMFDAVTDLDLRAFIELLPPDEARALHDYAPLFLDEVEQEAQRARDMIKITVSGLDVSATRNDDEARVKINRLGRVTVDATNEDTGQRATVLTYENGCVTTSAFAVSGQSQQFCQDDVLAGGLAVPFFGALGEGPKIDVGRPDLAFVAVQRNGRWFLSPTRTVLDGMVDVLKVFDRADLDAIRTWFEDLTGGRVDVSAGSAESTEPPISLPTPSVLPTPPTFPTPAG